MNEYKEIITSINDILNTANSLSNKELQEEFLIQNLDTIHKFKDSLSSILRAYQFKEYGNSDQNYLSDKLKNVISMLLEQKKLFENQPQFEYFMSNLLDGLNFNENKFAFNLQEEKNIYNIKIALEHLQTRSDYLEILDKNDYFQDESLNGISALNYRSSRYDENMIGHSLMQLKNNIFNVNKEDIIKILQCLDNSNFINKLIQKSDKQMDFYDKNLIFQYTDTILNLKSIFTPETLKDDKLVQAMWNGEIKDSKTVQSIIKNIPIDTFDLLVNLISENSNEPFIFDLASHFKQLNYSDKNIAIIIDEVLNKDISSYEIAKALAKIDIPKDLAEFIDSEHSNEHSWLLEGKVFLSLKEHEKNIEDARKPFLPAEYYIKKLDVYHSSSNIDKHFLQNLIMLLHSDYYTKDEKIALTDALKKNDLYISYITDEKITFDKNDSTLKTYEKVFNAYFSGQLIPLDISTEIINQLITKPKLDSTKINSKLLEACIQSVISNYLSEKGIDIGNRVFFGNGHSTNLGYYQSSTNSIWIDENLINKFILSPKLSDKAMLFRTVFHEMQHAQQYHNIDTGNIDYLTYNFIKEEIIEQYDKNFYDVNYTSIYMEADARKQEILDSLDFLKTLNPEFVKLIREKSEDDYIVETINHTIYGDSEKTMKFGENVTNINISDYIGLLIQSNPQILAKNPILSIEYNPDGSQKDIDTLLENFKQQNSENSSNYSNMYSIYYGLISRALEQYDNYNPEIQEEISAFLQEQSELITLADMQVLYKKVPVTLSREVYSRLLNLTRNLSPTQSVSKEGVNFDDNSPR